MNEDSKKQQRSFPDHFSLHEPESIDMPGFDAPWTLQSWQGRAILLVDLDAFFASVEQLDHPAWRGKPVIVGGDAEKHGVVSTASYEARPFGVHSAMPSSTAKRLCPHAIWTQGNFTRYREMSNAVMELLRRETPLVQQVSIDEAFCSITPTAAWPEHPVLVANRLQRRVEKLGISCSVGIGSTKTVAKIASDIDKPRGLTVVYPGTERAFLSPLPVRTLSGIGAAAEEKLKSRGIHTLGDLAQTDEKLLQKLFGKNGQVMRLRARGEDFQPVIIDEPVKSVSNEMTFAQELTQHDEMRAAVATMASKVGRRLRRKGLKGRTLGLKVRFNDRSIKSAQRRLDKPSDDDLAFTPLLYTMLEELWHPGTPVRLVGVSMVGFSADTGVQQSLFELDQVGSNCNSSQSTVKNAQKRRGLIDATDKVKNRFGESAVRFGRELRNQENTTGSASKNPADYKDG